MINNESNLITSISDKMGEPLLKVSTFGVHINTNPAGGHSFVGEVPAPYVGVNFSSFDIAATAFVDWFLTWDEDS